MNPVDPRCAIRAGEQEVRCAEHAGAYARGTTGFFFGFYYGGSRKGLL